jgi:hypothetical protein
MAGRVHVAQKIALKEPSYIQMHVIYASYPAGRVPALKEPGYIQMHVIYASYPAGRVPALKEPSCKKYVCIYVCIIPGLARPCSPEN